jgi:hypothetical protein
MLKKFVMIAALMVLPTASYAESCYGWVPACIAAGPASTPQENATRCRAAAQACVAACSKGNMSFVGPFGFHPVTRCK